MTKMQYRAIVRKQGIMCMVAALCALAVSIGLVIGLGIHCRQSCQDTCRKGAAWSK
jgi:hypothetical protein